jgi:hypothetical protein
MRASVPETSDCRDIVVVGASADGVESLIAFVGTLEADLPATILVVLDFRHPVPALPRSLSEPGKYRGNRHIAARAALRRVIERAPVGNTPPAASGTNPAMESSRVSSDIGPDKTARRDGS